MSRYASLSCGVEYLEIPKAACCSIKAALLEADGFPIVDGSGMHEHPHWREIPEDWQPKLTFTFVRHPLARLRSAYHEKLQTGLAKRLKGDCPLPPKASLAEWVTWVTSQQEQDVDRHWAPQTMLLFRYEARDKRKPDYIGRVETIAEDWGHLQSEYGLPDLPHFNRSAPSQASWPTVYDHDSIDKAVEFYQSDFSRFGYQENEYRPPPPIDAWQNVGGYLFDNEAEALQGFADNCNVLEIGCFAGRSTIAMAATAKHVWSVDHFLGDSFVGRVRTLCAAWRNLVKHHARHKVTLIAGDYRDILPRLDLRSFDALFYDADHTYAATAAALRFAEQMRPGIRIAVHDYKQNQPQIRRAVDEFLARNPGQRQLRLVGSLAVLETV